MEKIVQIEHRPHLRTNGIGRPTIQGGLFALTENGSVYFLDDRTDEWSKIPSIPLETVKE